VRASHHLLLQVVLLGRFNAQGIMIDNAGTVKYVDNVSRDRSVEAQVKRFRVPNG
jgi:hypothetical protein